MRVSLTRQQQWGSCRETSVVIYISWRISREHALLITIFNSIGRSWTSQGCAGQSAGWFSSHWPAGRPGNLPVIPIIDIINIFICLWSERTVRQREQGPPSQSSSHLEKSSIIPTPALSRQLMCGQNLTNCASFNQIVVTRHFTFSERQQRCNAGKSNTLWECCRANYCFPVFLYYSNILVLPYVFCCSTTSAYFKQIKTFLHKMFSSFWRWLWLLVFLTFIFLKILRFLCNFFSL